MPATGVIAAPILSLCIGFSMGLVGAGGALIAVPMLVYVIGIDPRVAIGMSLVIVAGTAVAGGLLRWLKGEVHLRAAVIFASTGMVGSVVGAQFTARVAPPVLMLLFTLLLGSVAWRMTPKKSEPSASAVRPSPLNPLECALYGLLVGLLTGFLGVGGGFLLVPLILKARHTNMHRATATSLTIIACNSVAGSIAHRAEVGEYWPLALGLMVCSMIGLLAGLSVNRKLPAWRLQQAFSWLCWTITVYMVVSDAVPLWNFVSESF